MSGSTSTLERIKHHTFELRDKRSRRPSVNAGVFVKVGTRVRGKIFHLQNFAVENEKND